MLYIGLTNIDHPLLPILIGPLAGLVPNLVSNLVPNLAQLVLSLFSTAAIRVAVCRCQVSPKLTDPSVGTAMYSPF